jgi:hypothetical protein
MPKNPKADGIRKEKQAKAESLLERFARNRKYKPDHAASLIEHMKDGSSFMSFGAVVGVSKATLYDWLDTYPEFKEAYEVAKLQALSWWEKQGKEGLWNTKECSLNTGAFVFQVANRFKENGYTRNPQGDDDTATKRLEMEVVQVDLNKMVPRDDV